MGQLLLFWLHKKEGRMDTITNTGAEGLLSILRHGLERHAEANSHRAWGSFMVCRAVWYRQDARLPTGRACKQTSLP